MFTYKIQQQRPHIDQKDPFLHKESILKRNLDKTWFTEGDRVKFKKPRYRPVYGTIVEIVQDASKVTWASSGLQPMNIVLDVEKVDHSTGQISIERVKTNVKKLLYEGRK